MNDFGHKILSTGIMIVVLIMGGSKSEVFALRNTIQPYQGRSQVITYFRQPIVPPGFPYYWVSGNVVDSFNKNKLDAQAIRKVSESDFNNLPGRAKEGVKFSLSTMSEIKKGCILSFETKKDMDTLKRYFLKRNKKGDLYTWTLSRDNILLVMEGTIPQREVTQYKDALNDLKR